MNAPQLAEERGLIVRETTSSSARDYVNLIELARAHRRSASTHVAGTLYGKQDAPRIVAIDDHIVDLPPSSHMLVVRNADTPGMIGRVGTILGDRGINIDEMDVGTRADGRRGADGAARRSTPVPPLDGRRRSCAPSRRRSSTPSADRARLSSLALGGAEAVGLGGVAEIA